MRVIACEDRALFAVYRAIYAPPGRICFDWGEARGGLAPDDACYWVYAGDEAVGGFALREKQVSNAFFIPGTEEREAFWKAVTGWLRLSAAVRTPDYFHLTRADADALLPLGARVKWSQQRMHRPTCAMEAAPPEGFAFEPPRKDRLPQIAQAVWEAHHHGYTTQVFGESTVAETEAALAYRFDIFAENDTLGFGVIARDSATGMVAGACIAGIYPDSTNRFSTIHQVAVRPAFQRRGLAGAMIRAAIGAAHPTSPVIGLQVVLGNPAERLYRALGFVPGPEMVDMAGA